MFFSSRGRHRRISAAGQSPRRRGPRPREETWCCEAGGAQLRGESTLCERWAQGADMDYCLFISTPARGPLLQSLSPSSSSPPHSQDSTAHAYSQELKARKEEGFLDDGQRGTSPAQRRRGSTSSSTGKCEITQTRATMHYYFQRTAWHDS